jgi:LPS-assembly lipoprotein
MLERPMRSIVEGASARATFRAVALALALTATTALAACSGLTPVYGERGIGVERHAFRYDKPASRLDQIIYQELVLKLGRATDPSVPLVRITTTSSVRGLTKTNVANPAAQKEAVVTARIELVDADGNIAYTATRSAAASFTTDRYQALAETEAEKEARERAARELAETVRLTLLGALANPA